MTTATSTILQIIPLVLSQLFALTTANNINTTTTTCSLPPPTLTSINNNTSSSFFTAHTPSSTSNNISTVLTAPLAAPLYHNVTAAAGDAWVYPNSSSRAKEDDLGARDLSCECFDPDLQCCMPASSSLMAPFCIMPVSAGSSCCGDTFCVAGESCCGDVGGGGGGGFCCPANTVCNPKITGSGCCPIGAICSGPAICYDHASSNCSNRASTPPQQCCPAEMPFCRDFEPNGLGCYVSSTTSSTTSMVQAMTAADTGDIFASPPPPSSSSSLVSTGMSSSTSIVTVTILVVSDERGGVSLEFEFPTPSDGSSSAVVSDSEETTYVLEWPASSGTAAAITDVTTSGGSGSSSSASVETETEGSSTHTANATTTSTVYSATAHSTSPSLSSSATTPPPQPTSPSPPRSTSKSPLCYDPTANSHSPCPTTSSTSSSSSSGNGGGFNPPGASIVSSQASKHLLPPFNMDVNLVKSFLGKIFTPRMLLLSLFHFAALYLSVAAFSVCASYLMSVREHRRRICKKHLVNDLGYTAAQACRILSGPGSVLFLTTDRKNDDDDTSMDVNISEQSESEAELDPETENVPQKITLVPGSAKPLLARSRAVEKAEIKLVEGSARPFVKGKRTHSLWEGMMARGRGEGQAEGDTEGGREGEGDGEGEGMARSSKGQGEGKIEGEGVLEAEGDIEGEGDGGRGLGHVFVGQS